MARNGLTGRERVCVSCENPNPGPIKLLYYRWRLHGPFFPLLERLKNDENARLFSNGRVPVCTSCANYLQRQWNDYERKNISLPIDKRTYRLLIDERWEKIKRKKQQEEASERLAEISSYDENELPEVTPSPVENVKPPRRSKIPRLANPNREPPPEKSPETSLQIVEMPISDEAMDERVRTAASKMAVEERNKVLRKLAEIKFQEELDYVQKKVQKTMGMVHLKGRDERIREIELELEKKIRNSESRDGRISNEKIPPTAIIPLENKGQENISELKHHIEKEMAVQRQEMDKLRKNIKNEISQAMDESYRRNEEVWELIKEMNAQKRSGINPSRRNRPYSDGDSLNKLPKLYKRMAKYDRMSDDYEDPESDQLYNGHR